jgi:hypothetical protein
MSDDEIVIDGGMPILIPEDEYDAECCFCGRVVRFYRPTLLMRFRIVGLTPHKGSVLEAWFPLGPSGKPGRGSKLVRMYRLIASDQRSDRISLKFFRESLWRIAVRTVRKDREQKPLPPTLWHSVVDSILGRIGPIGGR